MSEAPGSAPGSSSTMPLELMLRMRESVVLHRFEAGAPVSGPRAVSVTPAPVDTVAKMGFDASSSVSPLSLDGALMAVTDKEGIDIFDVSMPGKPTLRARVIQPGVVCAAFSPLGSMLLTWHRKKVEGEANLLLWNTSDGSLRASLHQKQYAPELWPPLRWTADEKLCVKAATDAVHVFDGAFPTPNPAPLQKCAAPHVRDVWPSPGPGPLYAFISFAPCTKSQPGVALMWSMPNLAAPTVARSLQADSARVEWAPCGTMALVEMTLAGSDDSYYGDSRLFLLARDGTLSLGIAAPKEGSTHDFAWSPRSDWFIVIAGKSPPAATLYNKKGVATFSFGAAAHNTIRITPNGHVALLAGFGNMGGSMTFWDVAKKTQIGVPASATCVVNAEWSPDSRYLLTATMRPRLQVDNGFRVWDYHGRVVASRDCDYLYDAHWRKLPASALAPARAPSPTPAGAAGAAAVSAAKVAYVPPSLRGGIVGSNSNSGGAGGLRLAAAAMSDRYTAPGKILQPGASGAASSPSYVRAANTPFGGEAAAVPLSQSALKKQKAKAREGKAAGAAAAEAAAEAALQALARGAGAAAEAHVAEEAAAAVAAARAARAAAAEPPVAANAAGPRFDASALLGGVDEIARKLRKKLRAVETLRAKREAGSTLTEAQAAKCATEASLLRQLAELGVVGSGEEESSTA